MVFLSHEQGAGCGESGRYIPVHGGPGGHIHNAARACACRMGLGHGPPVSVRGKRKIVSVNGNVNRIIGNESATFISITFDKLL